MDTPDTDELARAHWHATAATDAEALLLIARDHGISSELLEATVAESVALGPMTAMHVIEAAAANPTLGAERAWRWARGIDDPGYAGGALGDTYLRHAAQDSALRNPHNGPRADELADKRGHLVIGDLLTNPAAPTSFVDRYATVYATAALAHPNCSPEHLINPAGQPYTEAVANPALPAELAHDVLAGDHVGMSEARRRAARHPGITTAELETVLHDEIRRTGGSTALIGVLHDVLEERAWVANPLDQPARCLRTLAHTGRPDTVAERICALTDTQRDAIRVLLDQAFGGSVAELLDVAATF